MGRIRSHGSSIRKGENSHRNYSIFEIGRSSDKSCSQGGLRDGSTTVSEFGTD
jgi:hypothetical protein